MIFYINTYHLSSILISILPLSIEYLPANLACLTFNFNGKLPFLSLISPSVSFDFLGGIFLAVFNREKWLLSTQYLNSEALKSPILFSHFDNTFPHLRIYAHAFSNSCSYFHSKPLVICINGIREWSSHNPLVMSVRLPQALDIYREQLPFLRYIYCLNYAHRNFAADFLNIIRRRSIYSFNIRLVRVLLRALLLPYTYLSPFFYLYSKVSLLVSRYKGNL